MKRAIILIVVLMIIMCSACGKNEAETINIINANDNSKNNTIEDTDKDENIKDDNDINTDEDNDNTGEESNEFKIEGTWQSEDNNIQFSIDSNQFTIIDIDKDELIHGTIRIQQDKFLISISEKRGILEQLKVEILEDKVKITYIDMYGDVIKTEEMTVEDFDKSMEEFEVKYKLSEEIINNESKHKLEFKINNKEYVVYK
jgi:hypothetical protein